MVDRPPIEEVAPALAALADRLDRAVKAATKESDAPFITPALAVLYGRYVTYEAGSPQRISQGLQIAWNLMRAAAIDEGVRLYGPGGMNDDGPADA